ncbi:MAG: hypothetical protein WCX64_04025 [Candidatus Micrarchaeia archaeon]
MATLTVDQSGKWESSSDTVIGVTGATAPYSALVRHVEKRRIDSQLGQFRQERKRSKKVKVIRMFTYSVFLAVKLVIRKGDRLVIDPEYDGNEESIRELLIFLFNRFTNLGLAPEQVSFERVGKHSLAHTVANETFAGMRRPEKVLSFEDYFAILDRTAEIRDRAFRRRKAKQEKQAKK